MKLITRILLVVAAFYIGLCLFIYAKQKAMIFPGHMTKPVPEDWQPSQGQGSIQTLIPGHCGKLQVAIWKINNAKGTIMLFHGNGESLSSIDNYAPEFLNLGYNLMAWDYPGYGRSTDCHFSQADLLDDANAAYQWLSTQDNPTHIYLFGYSIGTGIALSVASKHSQNPVFLVAAYDSLLSVAQERMPAYIPVSLILSYPLDTQPWLDNITQPIFLIHGDSDRLIPPQHASRLVNNAHGKAQIEWVKQTGHAQPSLWMYRNEWLKRHLP
jgi:uncharacterized protein